jgi:hypothetical protein
MQTASALRIISGDGLAWKRCIGYIEYSTYILSSAFKFMPVLGPFSLPIQAECIRDLSFDSIFFFLILVKYCQSESEFAQFFFCGCNLSIGLEDGRTRLTHIVPSSPATQDMKVPDDCWISVVFCGQPIIGRKCKHKPLRSLVWSSQVASHSQEKYTTSTRGEVVVRTSHA